MMTRSWQEAEHSEEARQGLAKGGKMVQMHL